MCSQHKKAHVFCHAFPLRARPASGADAHAPQPPLPLLPPAASPRHLAAVADASDPSLVPSYARPSPWPAIHGDPAATPPRGRLRLQLRTSTAQAPRGRTFWCAASCVVAREDFSLAEPLCRGGKAKQTNHQPCSCRLLLSGCGSLGLLRASSCTSLHW